MAPKAEVKLPIRIQDSHPRTGDALRKEQDRYLRWQRSYGTAGEIWWQQDLWHGLPKNPDDTIPHVLGIRALLSDLIARGALPLPFAFRVTEFANGMCSRLFKLEFPEGCEMPGTMASTVLIRFAAPLDPYWKTESEVATMTFMATKTFVPVPQVYFFDSSANNSLGLEWVIMELIEGHTFGTWLDQPALEMTDQEMKHIGYEMNSFLLSLRSKQFDKIGSLYCDWETGEFYIGPMILLDFFHGNRLQYDGLKRGPFDSISEYFESLTDVVLWEAQNSQDADQEAIWHLTSNSDGEASGEAIPQFVMPPSLEDLQRRANQFNIELMPRLLSHVESLPTFANGTGDEAGAVDGWHAELMHPDLHSDNLLVARSESGFPKMRAIIDWDWTCVMPPPLVDFIPPLDLEYQERFEGRIRVPGAAMLQLSDILATGDAEHVADSSAQAFPNSGFASGMFKPAKKYIVKKALALRAAHSRVKRLTGWDARDEAWMANALKFLCEEEEEESWLPSELDSLEIDE